MGDIVDETMAYLLTRGMTRMGNELIAQIEQLREEKGNAVVMAAEAIRLCNANEACAEAWKLREENEQLRAALHWCGEIAWGGLNIDGGDFQEQMEKLGLMERVPASEEFRELYEEDTMFAWCWAKQEGEG